MAGPQDVVASVGDALAAAARCATDEITQNYDALAQELRDLGELARLLCEAHVDYRSLVRKLRAGNALSGEEIASLRLLIVGDADYYVKYDEEFVRCKREIFKIVEEINQLKEREFTADMLMHLNVLCREADSLLLLGQHYLEARDRVRRFEESTRGAIDRDSGRTLATIVEEMVARSQ